MQNGHHTRSRRRSSKCGTPRPLLSVLLAVLLTTTLPRLAFGQSPAASALANLPIEDLMNIDITSASRKEQRAGDVAAAVFVITHDDILRSGMSTLPDVLRMAPGIEVAQINANKWAVSIRGFNANYANKLLVLVDGRSIYNRIFSGVLWDTEDLLLDDIDRIEVIRGPGAALWGANAVNGVINIVTKGAAETQGALVRVEGGRSGEQGAAHYGGTLGAASYRLYSQWTRRDQSLIAPGARANDASHSVTSGFRADWIGQPGTLMLEGDFTAGQERALWPNLDPQTAAREPLANDPSNTQGGHLLGRWTQARQSGASFQIQSFVDVAGRQEPLGDYHRRAFGVDTQYHTALGARQDLVAGAGYRFSDETLAGHVGLSLTPAEGTSSLVTAFAQDEIALFGSRLAITLGSQVQYDSDTGAGVQPTARAMWKAFPRQRLWLATSRALRTPSLNERGIRVEYPPVPGPGGLPLVVSASGNPAALTETLVDAEVGYRVEIGTAASIDVTGFLGRYDHLSTSEVAVPVVQFVPTPQVRVTSQVGNQLQASTRGFEVAGHWMPLPAWRLDGSYSAFHLTPRLAASSQDPNAARTDGSAPHAQWQLRSAFSASPRATFFVAIFHVGPLEQLQVDAYTRADISAEWRLTSRWSAMAIGQNVFDAAHAEFGGTSSLLLTTQVPRSASLRLRWAF
jgi:iron complex outermembrane recepter protein